MTKLFTQNSKLKKAKYYTVNFGIPALKTCPQAKECKSFCYAAKGAYTWPVVKAAYEYRFAQTKKKNFSEIALKELRKIKKLEKVRIHDSGDFYSKAYLLKWFEIARAMPEKEFYAYSKRVKLIKDNWDSKPENLKIIFSLGGKEDNLINQSIDRHSKIFKTKEDLISAGYIDTSKDDSNAIGINKNIGLVLH